MFRRTFLACGLMLPGFGRRVWACPERSRGAQLIRPSARYAPLTSPVRIPLEAVKTPWRPVPFRAEAVAPTAGTTPALRVVISGGLVRSVTTSDRPGLSDLC